MRANGIFHPNFFYAPRRTTDSSQLVEVNIYRTTPEAIDWVPGQVPSVLPDTLIWNNKARVQPNKDWRARPREVQFEYDAVQAVRFQIPIGKNLVGATWSNDENRYTSYGSDPVFVKDMRVQIVSGNVKGFESMIGKNFYIRNAIQNQNLWVYNLLCDVKTGGADVT